ncbi:hypothetical protein BH24CHL1_BH24CHL1_20020 [soil metagenome]
MSSKRPNNESRTETQVHREVVDSGPVEMADDGMFRDRVRWGPIVAGVLTALTTLVVLTILGLAIGTTAFEPGEDGGRTVGIAAAIWGILIALLSFFVGGWIAGRNALASASDNGALNGFLVGAATIVVMLWLIGIGLGNVLGLAGANVDAIANLNVTETVTAQPDDAADTVTSTAVDAYDDARNSAWGTFAGLVIALGAATLGGKLGHPDSQMITTGARSRRTTTAPR